MTSNKHDWETLVGGGPVKVHFCVNCGAIVVKKMDRGEEGDWEWVRSRIERQPKTIPCGSAVPSSQEGKGAE